MDPVLAQDEVDGGVVTRWEELAGDPSDERQWSTSLEQHQKLFGHPPDQASGDRGVHSINSERVAQEKGIKRVILPQPGRKIVYSVPLMVELVKVLSRLHTQQKYHIRSDDITALINLIRL
jgi:hypothetical protein